MQRAHRISQPDAEDASGWFCDAAKKRETCRSMEEIHRQTQNYFINISKKGEIIMLEKGVKAPDFTLLNQEGEPVSLSGFLGKKVVLYFYPKDNTPGCTRQDAHLRAAMRHSRPGTSSSSA